NLRQVRALEFAALGSAGIGDTLLYTVTNVLLGVGVGTIVGFLAGLVVGRVRWVANLAQVPLLVLGTVPVLALLPFLSLWFGVSRIATSGLVIFYTAITVTVGVQQATRNVGKHYANYAATLGCPT